LCSRKKGDTYYGRGTTDDKALRSGALWRSRAIEIRVQSIIRFLWEFEERSARSKLRKINTKAASEPAALIQGCVR
jgi:hypothetical protein